MNSFYFCNMDLFVFISTVFIWTSGVSGLICHCDGEHCPDNHKNFTCTTKYKCFKVIQYVQGTNRKTKETHGCSTDEDSGGTFQCRSQKTRFHIPRRIECCNDVDYCNKKLKPTLTEDELKVYEDKVEQENMKYKKKKRSSQLQHLALAISITVCAMLLIIIVVYLALRYVQIKAKQKSHARRRVMIPNGTAPVGSMKELLLGNSSGTGSGVPILTQRTIAREVTLYEEVGRGRFGIVYKGRWREQVVAAKVVHMFDEISWRRELDFYETCNLIHENILGFVAGDIWEPIPGQEMQRLLITVFHEFGSLHDFLQDHSYDASVLYRLAYTAISGLVHVHRKVPGHSGKPALAHRDLKSKNILVKNNLQCCIGDFGLSIRCNDTHERKEIDFGKSPRLPTYRYMSPEMLNDVNTIYTFSFETYQKADIYSFGLVVWEMLLRYEVAGSAEEYRLPFTEYLDTDEEPTFSQMREIVVEQQKQLQLPEKYHNDEHAKVMIKLMAECCSYETSARLTALRIRKTLEHHLQDKDTEESNGSSIETASTGLS